MIAQATDNRWSKLLTAAVATNGNRVLEPRPPYASATPDAERAQKPPLPEPPYKPYTEKPDLTEPAYLPYVKKPALSEPPYEPYKGM